MPLVAAANGELHVSAQVEYQIRVLDVDGEIKRIVRRDLPLRQGTAEDAALEVQDPFRIRFGAGECVISAAEFVERRGFAEWVPSIYAIRAAPDGSLWVSRGPRPDGESSIDVISPTGEYLGTLPPETGFPAAFTPGGDVIRIEKDELDVERVVVYRLVRG